MNINFTIIRDEIEVHFEAMLVGEDLLVIVQGGDNPHIGSVAIGNHEGEIKALTFPFHKDNILLQQMLELLRLNLSTNICIVGGIHIDNITKDQIKAVLEIGKEGTEGIISRFKELRG